MNVLSLFDGMSCGRIALERAGIEVNTYYSSEIDKYAIQVAEANYPDTVHLGDVRGIVASELLPIDLLIGGSPCQGFSFAGKQLNFDDPRSALFFEYVRILKEVKPKYFLMENVRMKKEYQDIISEALGVEPIAINSNLVSAQNRYRLYWTNIPGVTQPEDKGIMLKDIIESERVYHTDGKGPTLSTCQGGHREPKILMTPRGNNPGGLRALDGETPAMSSSSWQDNNHLTDGLSWRKLTPLECERLQTVPDNYTNHVSNTQRYKMLGNGWTIDVIAHIFKNIPEPKNNEMLPLR